MIFRSLSLCCLLLALAGWSSPARADRETDMKTAHGFQLRIEELANQNPAAAVAEAKAFVAANGNLHPDALTSPFTRVRRVCCFGTGATPAGALAMLDEAEAQLVSEEQRAILVPLRADFLNRTGRFAEAETAIKSVWRPILARPLQTDWASGALEIYAAALVGQNRRAEILPLARTVGRAQTWALARDSQLAATLVRAFQEGGAEAEALSWAKLHFMLCEFSEESLSRATTLLVNTWTGIELSPRTAQAFVTAQSDASLPNPLEKIALPPLSFKEGQEILVNSRNATAEVSVNLAQRDFVGALQSARRALGQNPTSPEAVREVARVIKAHDLNVIRANAFLLFYTQNQGENPIPAFMDELQKEAPSTNQ